MTSSIGSFSNYIALPESFASVRKNLHNAALKAISVFERIKNNPSSLEQAVCIAKNTFSNLPKFHKNLELIEGTLGLLPVMGSLNFFYQLNSDSDFRSPDTISSISFGLVNLANTALWLRKQNLDVLGGAALSIGSSTLGNILTGGLIVGFSGMALSALFELDSLKFDDKQKGQRTHKLYQLAWTIGELALIVLSPRWPVTVAVKLIGIVSFLTTPKEQIKGRG